MIEDRAVVKPGEFVEVPVKRVARDGASRVERAAIQDEHGVDLFVNGVHFARFGCSAGHLGELAVGNLRTEGVISSGEQVMSLRVEGGVVYVTIAAGKGILLPPRPVTPVDWSARAVFRIADEFALDKTAHARTRGAHSAFLCDLEGAILCMREDVGRHNAFDKVVGWALLNDVDLTRCMLYTSGRVPSDMAMKAIRAGIPVLVSKSVPTDQGIALARTYGLTLICEASPK